MKDIYKLSPDQHEEILKQIMTDVFKDAKRFEHPEIFILGGQPGAGKSTSIDYLVSSGEAKDCLIINADEYRAYHPQIDEINTKYPEQMAAITDLDVRDWTQRIFAQAIENRNNIIFEGTMRTNQICETIKKLHEQGYNVNINVLAVNYYESKLSTYYRYEDSLKRGILARHSPPEAHDETYDKMLDTLQQIEDEGYYSKMTIYGRDKRVVFRSDRKNPKVGSVIAILRHRDKVWSRSKLNDYQQRADEVIGMMQNRGEHQKPEEIKSLKQNVGQIGKVNASKELSLLMSSLLQSKQTKH